MGERLPCKQEVIGSIPFSSTILKYDYSSVAQLVEQSAVNRSVGGSSPSRGAIEMARW
ncbi:hypothetical protein EMIT07CA2_100194 [Brevibacillus sp. IT-7CA2]